MTPQSSRVGIDMRSLLLVLTVYWCYVALSNVLWAHSLQAAMASDEHVFAPAVPRLLQHLFLYPVLIGCVWGSLRVGWQRLWRALPLQLLAFAQTRRQPERRNRLISADLSRRAQPQRITTELYFKQGVQRAVAVR